MEYPIPALELTKWRDFVHAGEVYELSHLHPVTMNYAVAGTKDKPACDYIADVIFSTHCFTWGPKPGEEYDRQMVYADSHPELRVFDPRRYKLSKHLPDVIPHLLKKKCIKTGHGNFFTIEVVNENGAIVEYDVFFIASKSSKPNVVNVYIQSAYVRPGRKVPKDSNIGFNVILFKALNRQSIPR